MTFSHQRTYPTRGTQTPARLRTLLAFAAGLFLAACSSSPALSTPQNPTRGPLPPPAAVAWQSPAATIDLNNVSRIKQIGSLNQHTATVNRMEFSHNGKLLSSVDGTRKAIVWDLTTGKLVQVRDLVDFAFFSPDDSALITVDDKSIGFYDVLKGTLLATAPGGTTGITGVAMSPDGLTLATGSKSGEVTLWDVARRTPRTTLPNQSKQAQGIRLVVFSPDGKTLATVSSGDSTVRLWKTDTGDLITTIGGFNTGQLQLLFSPDGAYFAAGIGNQAQVFNTRDNSLAFTLSLQDMATNRPMAFSPDGKLFAAGSEGDYVYVWTIPKGTLVAKLPEHSKRYTALAFSPASPILITMTAFNNAGAYVWNTETFKPEAERYPRGIIGQNANGTYTGAWSRDGKMIVLADASGALTVWGVTDTP